jgi:hypothetical protein
MQQLQPQHKDSCQAQQQLQPTGTLAVAAHLDSPVVVDQQVWRAEVPVKDGRVEGVKVINPRSGPLGLQHTPTQPPPQLQCSAFVLQACARDSSQQPGDQVGLLEHGYVFWSPSCVVWQFACC